MEVHGPMRIIKPVAGIGVLIVAAFAGGTLISAALAAPGATSTSTSNGANVPGLAGEYCQTYLDAFAEELGVTADEVTTAARSAATTAVDAAVVAGDLTEEQGADIKERIDDADGDCAFLGAHRPAVRPPGWSYLARRSAERGSDRAGHVAGRPAGTAARR
ncbi:MAG: hypothetical protein ABR509_06850 [Candidatus Limnocylindria bacterium]